MADQDQLKTQVSQQIQIAGEAPLPKTFQPSELTTPIFIERNAVTVPHDPIQNTNWVRRRISYAGPIYVSLYNDLFLGFPNTIQSTIVQSQDGRLITPVDQDTLERYTATIYRNTPTTILLNTSWVYSIAVYNNDVKILSSETSPNTHTSIPIALVVGDNKIDILLFTNVSGKTFDIGVSLRYFADGWSTPEATAVPAPTNLTVAPDPNAFNSRDPNVNVLRWDESTGLAAGGYRVYRRGPYNAGT